MTIDPSGMTLEELHAERHRIEKLLAEENGPKLAQFDATMERCMALLVEEGARRVADRLASDPDRDTQLDPSVRSLRMQALIAEGMESSVARVLDIIEDDPESYFGKDLVADAIWEILGRRGWRGATEHTVKQVFTRVVAGASVDHVERMLPQLDEAGIDRIAQELVEESVQRILDTISREGMGQIAASRVRQLVAAGMKERAARVLAVLERDEEAFLDDMPASGWEMLARGWKGATPQTVKQVFLRQVAEAAGERIAGGKSESERSARDSEWLWSDSMLMQVGVQLWNETYKHGANDDAVRGRCAAVASNWATGELSAGENDRGPKRQLLVEEVLFFTAKWAVHAFQRVTTAHTYAAALMCSDADRDSLETIETQWHAFLVQVPSGMLTVRDASGHVLDYNRVLVTQSEYGASLITLDQQNHHPARIVVERAANLADLLGRGEQETAHVMEGPVSDPNLRVIVLAKRLVAGLLLAMQHVDNVRSKTYPAKERKRDGRKREEPAHRVVFVGKPIQVDCRPAVRDYIDHGPPRKGSGPPSVQHVVRGHYKRQVVGIGRNGRKTIWIQPYWRGPDGAPIFTHPKKVGSN